MRGLAAVAIWHYAVPKGGHYFTPACKSRGEEPTGLVPNGQTLKRYKVNCPDCRRMMGLS